MVDAGVIIHENRFTYQEKGLHKIADLGEAWEQDTFLPIPLGGIVARRQFHISILKTIDRIIGRSLDYAFCQGQLLPSFVIDNAKEMSEDVMRNHINLYVNEYSLTLGELGKSAVMKLLEVSEAIHSKKIAGSTEVFL